MGGILAVAAVGIIVYGMVQLLPTWINVLILSVAALFVGSVFIAPQAAMGFLGIALVLGFVATILGLIIKFWAHAFGIALGILFLVGLFYGFASFA